VSVKSLYLYINGDTNNATVFISQNTAAGWKTVGYVNNQGYFKWIASTELNVVTDSLRLYLWVGEDIYEIVAVDTTGATIPIVSWRSENPQDTGVANLFDEQGLFEYPPTFRDQTCFDEVYFVRAAADFLAQGEPHEWTHPPLGKLIIAAGIGIFSFSPVGWRIMGVIFAALMIPVVYAAGLAIFKTRFAATAAALLLALDFMHFTMGRIGTVDTFLVFFSTVSLLFFYANFEGMMKGEGPRGTNVHYLITGGEDTVYRWRVRAPTYANLPAVPLMLRGQTLADASVIIGSIDPCISCAERVIVVDEASGRQRLVSGEELREGRA
jgi:hypothetical protein